MLFSGIYLIPALILLYTLIQTKEFSLRNFKISSVTRRLKGRMINFALFVFAGQFFNLLAKTSDTVLIFGLKGLSDTAIFAIATYVSAILEIPQRSLNSITIPVLAESWKNKDMANIKNIYHKSVSNLLAIGLLLFGLIWLNIDNLVAFLNFISSKYGGGYDELPKLIFILGLAKLIDLGTGVNSQIIGTSNYWKFDFYTNLFYIILSIPLNIFLINSYGLEGLAFSNLIALTLYNSIRFGFLYKKFDLQPYTWRHGLFLLSSIALMLLIYMIPTANNFVLNILIKSFAFGIAFYGLAYWINPAPEILNFFNDLIKNKIPGFFKRKS
jgi:O-antigen/teichoic acid export membrane protein